MLRSFLGFRLLPQTVPLYPPPPGTHYLETQSLSTNAKQFSNLTPLKPLVVLASLMQSEHPRAGGQDGVTVGESNDGAKMNQRGISKVIRTRYTSVLNYII